MTNPYPTAMSTYDPTAYYVMFTQSGRVFGGFRWPSAIDPLAYSGETIPPGGLAPLYFGLGPQTFIRASRIGYVRLSVDPGYIP